MTDHHLDCDGTGFVSCHWCMGSGTYEEHVDDLTYEWRTCPECHGRGGVLCPACEEGREHQEDAS